MTRVARTGNIALRNLQSRYNSQLAFQLSVGNLTRQRSIRVSKLDVTLDAGTRRTGGIPVVSGLRRHYLVEVERFAIEGRALGESTRHPVA